MTSASLPLTNVGSGYTIVTKVVPSFPVPAAAEQNSSQTQLQNFLKGEPKALGVVQIMIGLLTISFGIVLAVSNLTLSIYTGIVFWGSLFYIIAGSLAVSASNKLQASVVKAAMGLNIFSTIVAAFAIAILSLDYMFGSVFDDDNNLRHTNVISGVLIVFSLLQFAVSFAVSVFTCKALRPNPPTLDTIAVVPNSASGVLVVSSIPAYQAQPVSTMGAVAMSNPPVENPPAYCEKGEADT